MTLVAVDLGAEYVDVAVLSGGECSVWKAAADTPDPADSVVSAAAVALERAGLSLSQVAEMRLGTTTGVNALLRRDGARVALITTRGFGDVLTLARQNRAELYDPVARSPAPGFLAARTDTFEVGGRIGADGAEVEPLERAAIAAIAEACRARGIADIAICLLFAHVNPAHEVQIEEVFHATAPELRMSLSHRVDPQPREYERTVSTCLEAFLAPAETRLLEEINFGLGARGFAGRLMLANSRGGLVPVDIGRATVSRLLGGGPAAVLRLASAVAAEAGAGVAISLDVGSTSSDIGLIRGAEPPEVEEAVFAGVPLRQPIADITSVALGARSLFDGVPLGEVTATLPNAARDLLVQAIVSHCVRRNADPAQAALIASGGLGPALAIHVAGVLGITRILLPAAPEVAGALGLLLSASLAESRVSQQAGFDVLEDGALARSCAELAEGLPSGQVLFFAQAAPTANMHRVTLGLGADVPTATSLRGALNDYFREMFGIDCPGEGYLFALIARVKGEDAQPLPQVSPPPRAEPGEVRTALGAVPLPAGWLVAAITPSHVELRKVHADG